MKALLGVDGSAGSFVAVEWAAKLLSAEHDQLVLYYSPPEISIHAEQPPDPNIIARARQALAEAIFRETQARLPAELAAQTEQVLGTQRPQHGLLTAAEQYQAEMIIVGARGTGPLESRSLGGVARTVAHAAPVPVLLARPRDESRANEPLRVLLTYDPAEPNHSAADIMAQLTLPAGSIGRVIAVVQSLFAGQVPDWLEEAARRSDAEAMAKAWVEHRDEEESRVGRQLVAQYDRLPPAFHGHLPIVCDGHPAEQILQTIERERIDLVAVGARGLGPISRLLLGSTSEQILVHAPCSVLIARQAERS